MLITLSNGVQWSIEAMFRWKPKLQPRFCTVTSLLLVVKSFVIKLTGLIFAYS